MQCKATNREGGRCGRHAIAGGFVCNLHGGSAPQVLAAAKLRLAGLVDPSIDALTRIIKTSKHHPSVVSAAKDLLDRAGLKPADKLQLEAGIHVADPGREQLSDADLERLIATAKQLRITE